MYFVEAEQVVYNFLRARVSELSRTGLSDRMTSDTQIFAGDASTKEFTLTNQPEAIVTVDVDGTEQVPYLAYNIDLDNKKIKFSTAPANSAVITVTFKTGTNWIYPDSPRADLKKTSYPRIGLWQISKAVGFEEVGSQANTYDSLVFQIDVLAYKDQICSDGSETMSGGDVTKYIARRIENAFKDYTKTDLIYVVYNFQILDNSPAPFQEDLNIYRQIVQVRLDMRNMRRMITATEEAESYLLLESGDFFLLENGDKLILG